MPMDILLKYFRFQKKLLNRRIISSPDSNGYEYYMGILVCSKLFWQFQWTPQIRIIYFLQKCCAYIQSIMMLKSHYRNTWYQLFNLWTAYFVDPYSVKIYFTKINSLSNYNYFIIFYYLHLSFIIFAIGSRGNWEVFAVGFIPSTNIYFKITHLTPVAWHVP